MSETINVAEMAKEIYESLFQPLNWEKKGPEDIAWKCENPAHGKKLHPTDSVFYYKDPFTGNNKFFNVDLKSYGKESISKASIFDAIKPLYLATQCACISAEWSTHFLGGSNIYLPVDGLLFIYNHDNQCTKNTKEILHAIATEHAFHEFQGKQKVFTIGHEDVGYLVNIANDITVQRGKGVIPFDRDKSGFFYPDSSRGRMQVTDWGLPATIEAILSDWMFYRYMNSDSQVMMVIYYKGTGEDYKEFTYLIDMIVALQLLINCYRIKIKGPNLSRGAAGNLDSAIVAYSESTQNPSETKGRLAGKLSMETIPVVRYQFQDTLISKRNYE